MLAPKLRRKAGSTLRIASGQRAAVYPPTDGPLFPSMSATQGEPNALWGAAALLMASRRQRSAAAAPSE